MLDIYGFENLKNNCLEQLCINYANEKLQQCFIESFFKLDQQDYTNESIPWTPITYNDNLPVLSLLEQTNECIFNLINEESILKRNLRLKNANSHVLVTKINATLKAKNVNNTLQNVFEIKHYAGSVIYNAQNLIYKNNDRIPDDLASFLARSSNKFLADEILVNFFHKQNHTTDDSGRLNAHFNKKKSFTVLTKFKKNLDNLIRELKTSEINYVRCVKPNQRMEADYFDTDLVYKQLEACGIVSILNMSKASYSNKYAYFEFVRKFMPILTLLKRLNSLNSHEDHIRLEGFLENFLKIKRACASLRKSNDSADLAELKTLAEFIAAHCEVDGAKQSLDSSDLFKLGETRIFLKNSLLDSLDEWNRLAMSRSASVIQRKWRAVCERRLFAEMRRACVKIQRWFKSSRLRSLKSDEEKDSATGDYSTSSATSVSVSVYGSATNSITKFFELNITI